MTNRGIINHDTDATFAFVSEKEATEKLNKQKREQGKKDEEKAKEEKAKLDANNTALYATLLVGGALFLLGSVLCLYCIINPPSRLKLHDEYHPPKPVKYLNSAHRAEYVYVEEKSSSSSSPVHKLIPVKIDRVDAVEGINAHTKVTKYTDGSSLIAEGAKLFSFRKGKANVAEIKPNRNNTYHVADENTFTRPGRKGIEDAGPLLYGNFICLAEEKKRCPYCQLYYP